ncbi:MAG: hypothetical protein ACI4PM_04675 [Butyricicoccus sp.]
MKIVQMKYGCLALLTAALVLTGCGSAPSESTADTADSDPAAAASEIVPAGNLDLEDGDYIVEVALNGGSGRADVQSPAEMTVRNGEITATIVWSSANYDYMVVDGETYEPVSLDPGSTFAIPVSGFDGEIPVAADTTAMSEPHEISYTLTFDSTSIQEAK